MRLGKRVTRLREEDKTSSKLEVRKFNLINTVTLFYYYFYFFILFWQSKVVWTVFSGERQNFSQLFSRN